MKYSQLQAQVRAAENAVVDHLAQVGEKYSDTHSAVKEAITPLRVVGAGALSGFLMGLFQPTKYVSLLPSVARLLSNVPGAMSSVTPWIEMLQSQLGNPSASAQDQRFDTPQK